MFDFPILPDELTGCPYGNGVAEMCGMGTEHAAKNWCRLGCSPICSQLMIQKWHHKQQNKR